MFDERHKLCGRSQRYIGSVSWSQTQNLTLVFFLNTMILGNENSTGLERGIQEERKKKRECQAYNDWREEKFTRRSREAKKNSLNSSFLSSLLTLSTSSICSRTSSKRRWPRTGSRDLSSNAVDVLDTLFLLLSKRRRAQAANQLQACMHACARTCDQQSECLHTNNAQLAKVLAAQSYVFACV